MFNYFIRNVLEFYQVASGYQADAIVLSTNEIYIYVESKDWPRSDYQNALTSNGLFSVIDDSSLYGVIGVATTPFGEIKVILDDVSVNDYVSETFDRFENVEVVRIYKGFLVYGGRHSVSAV